MAKIFKLSGEFWSIMISLLICIVTLVSSSFYTYKEMTYIKTNQAVMSSKIDLLMTGRILITSKDKAKKKMQKDKHNIEKEYFIASECE